MEIDDILSPITKNQFKDKYFKKESLYIAGKQDKFSKVFNWDDLNNLLDYSLLPDKNIRIVKDSSYKKCSSIDEIKKSLNDGYSLIFNKLHQKCKKIGLLTEKLGSFFNEPAQVNLYMSQPGINGFSLHYDTHDVIVLQVYGCKHWDIYSPTVDKPVFVMKNHGTEKPDENEKPYMSQTLTQGDMLYVPRGHWHFPIATGSEPSLHLTFGIKSRTGLDFIKWLKGELTDSLLWREEFNFSDKEHFKKIKKDLIEILNSESTLNSYREYSLMNLWIVEEINLPQSFTCSDSHNIRSSKLYIRRSVSVIKKIVENNIVLLFNNKKITLSNKTEIMIDHLLSRKILNLSCLSDYHFDLNDEQIYKVSEVLFSEGILSIDS